MPFIEQNIDKGTIRPATRFGRLSPTPKTLQGAQLPTFTRPRSQMSNIPKFQQNQPVDKLYSQPSPQNIFAAEKRDVTSLKLNLKKYNQGALILPLELTADTAYLKDKAQPTKKDPEKELGPLAHNLKEKRQQLENAQTQNYQNQLQDNSHQLSNNTQNGDQSLPKVVRVRQSSSQFGDRVRYYQRPKSELQQVQKQEVVADFPQQSEIDVRKRMEQQTRNQLEQVHHSKSLSAFGKSLDCKVNTNKITIPRIKKVGQPVHKMGMELNQWIVQSREGTAKNTALKQEINRQQQNFFELPPQTEEEKDYMNEKQQQLLKQQKNLTHKQLVESIVTSIDDVLPIFLCISQRLKMEQLIKSGNYQEQLKQFFRQNKLDFNPSSAIEAKQYGEDYYKNLKQQYANLLKSAPEAVANSLIQNEFIYLTYDTQPIRKMLIHQFLENSNDLQHVYDEYDPDQNIYQLVVCSYQQINPQRYFTISGAGVTLIREQANENSVILLEQWQDERDKYLKLRKIKYIRDFLMRKQFVQWHQNIRLLQKNRSLAAVQRLSLFGNDAFCILLRNINTAFQFQEQFTLLRYKSFTFINMAEFLQNFTVKRLHPKYESMIKQKYTQIANNPIYLTQFVQEWRHDLQSVKQKLYDNVSDVSDQLLMQCKQIQQQIQQRILEQSDKQKQKQASAIISAVSSASTFNMIKMRSLVKVSDYMLSENLIQFLVDINQRLFEMLFGIAFEIKEKEIEDNDVVTKQRVIPGFDVMRNSDSVQKYYIPKVEEIEDQEKQQKSDYENLLEFIESLKYEEIIYQDYSAINDKNFNFDKNNKRSVDIVYEADDCTSVKQGEYGRSALKNLLNEAQMEKLMYFKNQLTNVPLVVLNGYYPPAPLFLVDLSLCQYGIDQTPKREDFINFLGDCLSELATIFHKTMRPYNYPKLQSFLSEATRSNNLQEFVGVIIKDALAVTEDYLSSIQQIKYGIMYTFDIINKYQEGINVIFQQVINVMQTFQYSSLNGIEPVKSNANLLSHAVQVLQLTSQQHYENDNMYILYLLFYMNQYGLENSQMQFKIYEFFKIIVFPELLNMENYLTDSIDFENPELAKFDFPPFIMQYAKQMMPDFSFNNLLALISPEQFQKRLIDFQELIFTLEKLNCKRNFMCMNVNTQKIYEQLLPIVIKLIIFVKVCIIIGYISTTNTLEGLLNKYVNALNSIPEYLFQSNSHFLFPDFTQINNSLTDFSILVCYDEHTQPLNQETEQLIEKLEDAQKEFRSLKSNITLSLSEINTANEEADKKKKKAKSKKAKRDKSMAKLEVLDEDQIDEDAINQEQNIHENQEQKIELQEENGTIGQNIYKHDDERIVIKQFTSHGQLPELVKIIISILREHFDAELLKKTKQVIETYDVAKSQLQNLKEFESRLSQQLRMGANLSILNDVGNMNLSDEEAACIEGVFGVKQESQLKDRTTQFGRQLQQLDQLVLQFTIKKPRLNTYFQKSLLNLFMTQLNNLQEFLYNIMFYQNDFLYSSQSLEEVIPEFIYNDQRYLIQNNQRQLQSITDLYMFLFSQKQLKMKSVEDQLNQLEDHLHNLQQYKEQLNFFNNCIQLFEATEFNINDGSLIKRNELDHIIQFCEQIVLVKKQLFEHFMLLKNIITNELSYPVSLVDFEQLHLKIVTYKNGFINIQQKQQKIYEELLNCLVHLSMNENKTKLLSYNLPNYYHLNDLTVPNETERTEMQVETDEDFEDIKSQKQSCFASFTVLKYIFYAYKQLGKKFQLQLLQQYATQRNIALQKTINEVEESTNQLIETTDIQLRYYLDDEHVIVDDFVYIDMDEASFPQLVKDCLQLFVQPQNITHLAIDLLKQLEQDCKKFKIFSTIKFQPRHFQELLQIVPSPDWGIEVTHWNDIVNIQPKSKDIHIYDMLANDTQNAYRSLFGPSGDGILEMVIYSIIFNSRKENVLRNLENFAVPQGVIINETTNIFDIIDSLQQLYMGQTHDDYTRSLQQKIKIQEYEQMEQIDTNTKLSHTDIENKIDQEAIEQRATLTSTNYATIAFHNEAVRLRLCEIIMRRINKANIFSSNPKSFTKLLTKGGYYMEMDRFTCSITRLLIHGIYSKNKQQYVYTLLEQAEHEYYLLNQLSTIKTQLKQLKLHMRTDLFGQNDQEQIKLHRIGDTNEIVSQVKDKLIELQTLEAQCQRLQNSNITLAIIEIQQLMEKSKQAIITVQDLINYQQQFNDLFQVFGVQTQISKNKYESAKLFQKISKLYIQQMQLIYDNGRGFLDNCTTDLSHFIMIKLQQDTDIVQNDLDNYLYAQRNTFKRFYFLSKQMLCKYLSVQSLEAFIDQSISTINKGIEVMFDGVAQIILDSKDEKDDIRKLQIVAIKGKDNDEFQLKTPVIIKNIEIERWTSNMQMNLRDYLQQLVVSCYFGGSSSFYDMLRVPEDGNVQTNMFSEKVFLQWIGKNPIQILIVCKWAIITKYLKHFDCFYEKSVFSQQFQEQDIQTSKIFKQTTLIQMLNAWISLQETIIDFLVKQIKFQRLPDRFVTIKYQQMILNEQQILDYLYKIKSEDNFNCLVYVFNEVERLIYVSSKQDEEIKRQIPENMDSFQQSLFTYSELNMYKGTQYKYEYYGLIQRLILTESLQDQYVYLFQNQDICLLVGKQGYGKSSIIQDYSRVVGQYNYIFHCQKQTKIQFVKQIIQGSLEDGCYISFDDVSELDLLTISVLSVYMQNIRNQLLSKIYKVIIDGEKYNINQSVRILLTAENISNEFNLQTKFRSVAIIKPKMKIICQYALKITGFQYYQQIGEKIAILFKYLQSGFIIQLVQFDVSFRKTKAILILIEVLWQRWAKRMFQNEKLEELLKPSTSQRIIKEQQQFLLFIEQFCACQAIYTIFTPALTEKQDQQNFNKLLASIFDEDIINQIANQNTQTYTVLATSKFAESQNKNFDFIKNKNDASKLESKQLYDELLLTKDDFKPLDTLKNQKIKNQYNDIMSQLVVEEQDYNLMSSQVIKKIKRQNSMLKVNQEKQPIQQNQIEQIMIQDEIQESVQISSAQAQNYIQNIQSSQKAQTQEQYIKNIKNNNQFMLNEQIDKYVEFEQSLWIRNGVIILGDENSGKTSLWNNSMDKSNIYNVINPEYMSVQNLFGFYNKTYYTDGVIPQLLRQYQQTQLQRIENISTSGLKYIVFDGKIGADVADFMNPMLDDAKMLELVNGERIRLPNNIRFLFEFRNLENITPSFISRCAVVVCRQSADFWKCYLLKQFRCMFEQEYAQFVKDYEYQDTDFVMHYQQFDANEATEARKSAKRYKKRTRDQIIGEKVQQVVTQQYKYANNFYINVMQLFIQLFTDIQKVCASSQQELNNLQFICQVLSIFTQFIEYVCTKYQTAPKQIKLRHLRNYMIISISQVISYNFEIKFFNEAMTSWADQEFKEISEIYQIELITRLDQCFYDEQKYIPCRFIDNQKYDFGYDILSRNTNNMLEIDVLSCDFNKFNNQIVIQTPIQRQQMFILLKCIQQRKQKLIYINKDLFQLLQIHQLLNNSKCININSKLITVEQFIETLNQYYQAEGLNLVPKTDGMCFVFNNSSKMDLKLVSLIRFIVKWKKININFGDVQRQYELQDVQFIFVDYKHDMSFYDLNGITFQQKHNLQQKFNNELQVIICTWQQMDKINSAICPIFQAVQQFVQLAVELVKTKHNVFDYDLACNIIKGLICINNQSFIQQLQDPEDAASVIPFKRHVIEALFYILRIEYFIQLNIPEKSIIQILTECSDKYLSNHVYELKPTPNMKSKKFLHSYFLFKNDTSCLTPLISKQIQKIYLTKNSLINNEINVLQKLIEPLYSLQLVKSEWSKELHEQFIMTNKITEDMVKYPSVYQNSKLVSYCNNNMKEVCERFNLISYLFATRKHTLTQNLQQKLSIQLYKQVCTLLEIRFMCLHDGEQQQNEKNSSKIMKKLKQILLEVQDEIYNERQYKEYCLYINADYCQDKVCLQIINELISGTYNFDSNLQFYDINIFQHTRLLFNDDEQISQIQLINVIKKILQNCVRIVVVANTEEYNQLKQIHKTSVYCERIKSWSLQSIIQESVYQLFKSNNIKYLYLKPHENMFTRNKDIIVNCFNQVVDILSNNQPELIEIFMTPFFFSKFIEFFFDNYNKQIIDLATQIRLLKNAFSIFEQSSKTAEEFNLQIKRIVPELESQKIKLQIKQADSIEQKVNVDKLSKIVLITNKELELQVVQISKDKIEADQELDSITPIYIQAQKALKGMTIDESMEISRIKEPSKIILSVISIICILLDEKSDWANARIVIGKGDFISKLLAIDPLTINNVTFNKFKKMIEINNFDVQKITQISKSVATLAQFAIAFSKFAEVKQQVHQKQLRVEELQKEYNIKKQEYDEQTKQLQILKQKSEQLQIDIEQLEQQTQKLEQELTSYQQQHQNVSKINEKLLTQQQSWQQQLKLYEEKEKQIVYDILLMSCYNLLQVNQLNIGKNLAKIMNYLVRKEVISESYSIEEIVNHLITQEGMLNLTKYSLTSDIYTKMQLYNLSLIKNNMIVQDPSNQFLSYINAICHNGYRQKIQIVNIQNYYQLNSQQQETLTLEVKESIIKAVSQGDIFVILCNVNKIPQYIFNIVDQFQNNIPQLISNNSRSQNQTNNTASNQQVDVKEVIIDQYKVEVNKKFQLFMVDQITVNYKQINSEILQQYNLISFQKQEETIQKQILSIITQIKNKSLQEKYIELMQCKSQIQNENKLYQTQLLQIMQKVNINNPSDQIKLLLEIEKFSENQLIQKEKMEELTSVQQQIEEKQKLYVNDSKQLSDIYNNLLDICQYPLNLFIQYVQMFIDNGIALVVQYLMHSIYNKDQVLFQLQKMMASDLEQQQNENQQFLKMMQSLFYNDCNYIVIDRENVTVGKKKYIFNEKNCEIDQQEIENIFADVKEELGQQELQRRRFIIGTLTQGLFKQLQNKDNQEQPTIPSYLSDQSIYYKAAYKCTCTANGEQYENYDNLLQKEITNSIIMNWQKYYLQLLKKSPNSKQIINDVVNLILEKFKAAKYTSDKIAQIDFKYLQKYLALIYTKIFIPEELGQCIVGEIKQMQEESQDCTYLIDIFEKTRQIRIFNVFQNSDQLLQDLCIQYQHMLTTNADKPHQQAQIKLQHQYYYSIDQLNNLDETIILVVDKIISYDEYKQIILSKCRKIVYITEQNQFQQQFLEIPLFIVDEVINYDEQASLLSKNLTQDLLQINDQIDQSFIKQQVENLVFVFKNINITQSNIIKKIDFLEFRQSFQQLKELILRCKILNTKEDNICLNMVFNNIKQLITNKYVRNDFQNIVNYKLFQKQQNQPIVDSRNNSQIVDQLNQLFNIKDAKNQFVYQLTKKQQPIYCKLIIHQTSQLQPLQQYFVQNSYYLNKILGNQNINNTQINIDQLNSQLKYHQLMLDYIKNGKQITEIQISNLLNIPSFFQFMLLQAVYFYGGCVNDYSFMYGYAPNVDNDCQLLFNLYNGYYNNNNQLICYQANNKQQIKVKLVVKRNYKRRILYLPLASYTYIEKVKDTANQEAQLLLSGNQDENTKNSGFIDLNQIKNQFSTIQLKEAHSKMQIEVPTTNSVKMRPGSGMNNASKSLTFEKRLNQYLASATNCAVYKENLFNIQVRKFGASAWVIQMPSSEQLQNADLDVLNIYLD